MKTLITAALPYANGPLHFGHIAGAYLPADCYARFQRLLGSDVCFICGSDEHGVAITLTAEQKGTSPQEHIDTYHAVNYALFRQLNVSFDHYSRTSRPIHREPAQQFFLDLLKNGYIEERVTDQLYSEEEGRFYADRYVVGHCPKCGFEEARGDECTQCGASYEATELINPRAKISGNALSSKATKHWFLRFDLFKEKLKEWIEEKRWKSNVVEFAKHYIDELKPRAITRDGEWGIPVPLPEAEGKVLYVWFEAPIGYISATMEWAQFIGEEDAWKAFWLDPQTKYVQFIGKDNIPFHAVFFPAMIMGQNTPYKMVDDLPANEFLSLEGKQFSKSNNHFIDLADFFEHFSSEQARYALAANAPENHDSEFTWSDFAKRCNSELVGKLGNFVHRVLVFTQNHVEHRVPPLDNLQDDDQHFTAKVDELLVEIKRAYASYSLRKATQLIMELAQEGNAYFNGKKPWALAKDVAKKGELESCMACCFYAIKALALGMCPILPQSAEKIWAMIGYTKPLATYRWDDIAEEAVPKSRKLPTPEVVFQKVDDALIKQKEAALQTS